MTPPPRNRLSPFLHLLPGRHTPVSHATRLTFQLRPSKRFLIKELSKGGMKCLWSSVITRSLNTIVSSPSTIALEHFAAFAAQAPGTKGHIDDTAGSVFNRRG